MPESDVIIAQCAIYLARAPKSTEAYVALTRCKRDINECKGPLPSVPLHLRNAPTKLMKDLGKHAVFLHVYSVICVGRFLKIISGIISTRKRSFEFFLFACSYDLLIKFCG